MRDSDLDEFFDQQRDPAANQMAAFTAAEPADRTAFMVRWVRLRGDSTITIKTILVGDDIAGHILSYQEDEPREISYWIAREYWGRGIATRALTAFLKLERTRPLAARVVTDNHGSRRVLEKCGFVIVGSDRGFANARGKEVDELILVLRDSSTATLVD
ncbi:MAG: GNAT family N-acetyltransferase [Chloroflexota bacterium]|nr:GNAT family N-acetyltransferase [Chloroflexota bacterium]